LSYRIAQHLPFQEIMCYSLRRPRRRKYVALISLIFVFVFLTSTKLISVLYNIKSTKSRCCGPGCRTQNFGAAKHYNAKYFAWQTKLGKEKAEKNDWTKLIGINEGDVVADLGAGGGHILNSIKIAKRLIAVELSQHARSTMNQMYPQIETWALRMSYHRVAWNGQEVKERWPCCRRNQEWRHSLCCRYQKERHRPTHIYLESPTSVQPYATCRIHRPRGSSFAKWLDT